MLRKPLEGNSLECYKEFKEYCLICKVGIGFADGYD